MSLLNNLKSHLTARKQSTFEQYIELLERSDNPKEGDTDALMAAMATLQISYEQCSSDADAVRFIQELKPHILDQKNRMALYVKAKREYEQYLAETERLLNEVKTNRTSETERLYLIQAKANGRASESRDAISVINKRSGEYRRLYPSNPLNIE